MEDELRYAEVNPDDMSVEVIRQMLAVKDALEEDGEAIPIPSDSPLGEYLLQNSKPLPKDDN